MKKRTMLKRKDVKEKRTLCDNDDDRKRRKGWWEKMQ